MDKIESKTLAMALIKGLAKELGHKVVTHKICTKAEVRHVKCLATVVKTLTKGDTNGK